MRGGALRLPEFRALAVAGLLSATGDQLARVALSVLVYDRTSSALLTALTYALTFLPAVLGGPLLSGLADRRPRRRLMVGANLLQALAMAAMAVPRLPLGLLLGLLVVVNVLAAPFNAARAALMPDVTRDRYVSALVVDRTLQQTAQVLGFVGTGLLLLVLSPSTALIGDAASFLASAVLLRGWVLERAPATALDGAAGSVGAVGAVGATGAAGATGVTGAAGRRSRVGGALHDASLGTSTIWRDPRVRQAVLVTWVVSAFAIVPEALAAPYARTLTGGPLLVALLMAANPVGNVVSGLWARRWSSRGERALGPLAQLAVLPLAFCLLRPPASVVLGLVGLSGVGMTVSLVARTVFVANIPTRVRGRAFGVAAAGITVSQGVAVAIAGAAASPLAPSTVIGAAGLVGSAAAVVLTTATRVRA